MAGEDEKKEKKKDEEVITAVYKVYLHCEQCARDIKKPLSRTQGVHSVDLDVEKGELKVKGVIDPVKIRKRLEKLSKKKVELVSPKIEIKETVAVEKKEKIEVKESIRRTTTVKVFMHCPQCEQELKKKLIRHKGVHSVKTDFKAETLTVEGTIESDKLLSYLKRKVHKHAEIISSKPEKKEEKKGEEKAGAKPSDKPAEKGEGKSGEKPSGKGEGKSGEKPSGKGEGKPGEKPSGKGEGKPGEKPPDTGEGKPGEKPPDKGEGKPTEKSAEVVKTIELREEIKIVEVKTKEGNAPYFIHYVYAPQMFSDENPNACSIM